MILPVTPGQNTSCPSTKQLSQMKRFTQFVIHSPSKLLCGEITTYVNIREVQRAPVKTSVGVLEDKSSSSRILEDNLKSLVLALQVESLASWLKSLEKTRGHTLHQSFMFCTNDFKGNNLEFCPLPITE